MHNIGICGAGLIGASWAVGFANHGYNVLVYDANPEILSNFFKVVDQLADDLEIFQNHRTLHLTVQQQITQIPAAQ